MIDFADRLQSFDASKLFGLSVLLCALSGCTKSKSSANAPPANMTTTGGINGGSGGATASTAHDAGNTPTGSGGHAATGTAGSSAAPSGSGGAPSTGKTPIMGGTAP